MASVGDLAAEQAQHDFINVFYQYAYLNGRSSAGVNLDEADNRRLLALGAMLEHNDGKPRVHRRRPTTLSVLIKVGGKLASGTVLNISGGGMFVACPMALKLGRKLRVTIGRKGETQTQYIFTCEVVRSDEVGWGLRFVGVPLEIRYGSYARTPLRAAV